MRSASRIGSLGVYLAALSFSASCVENSRSLPSCLPASFAIRCSREVGRGQSKSWRSRLAERGDLLQQVIGPDRLGDVVTRALTQAPDAVGLQALAGAHDDRKVLRGRILRQLGGPRKTILPGPHHALQDTIRMT